MILPTTYTAALLLSIVSMLCWGSWANTSKLTKKWRFELFYFDYSFGVLIAALIAAFTFGMMGQNLSFADNLDIAGKRQWGIAMLGGVIFNLANMLLVGAISLAGLAVAFPIGIGMALVIGVVLNFIIHPAGSPILLFGGAALVVAAIVVDALAYSAHSRATKVSAKRSSFKGIALSIGSGILMGSFYPVVQLSMQSEIGLAPYGVSVMFAIGVVLSTFIFNLYFMNLPIQGAPVPALAYFKGSARNHLLGLAGGVIWSVGAIANFVAGAAQGEANIGPAVSYALGQGATMISALWGLLLWKEFAGADARVKRLLAAMIVLFVSGLALVSIAPLYGTAAK
jgi:glucose uptake protein